MSVFVYLYFIYCILFFSPFILHSLHVSILSLKSVGIVFLIAKYSKYIFKDSFFFFNKYSTTVIFNDLYEKGHSYFLDM